MRITPQNLGTSERYKLIIGCISPRPIALVSTLSPNGIANLAPFSFFTGIGSNPMTLLFCPVTDKDGNDKDTLRNSELPVRGGTGEFVVNLAVEAYAREVAAAAEAMPYEESEFELTGLTPAPCAVVKAPRVAESPVSFECRTLEVIRTNPGQPAAGNVVIGEVVQLWVRDDLVDERFRVDQERLATFGRMGGPLYTRTAEQFRMERGVEAMQAEPPFEPRAPAPAWGLEDAGGEDA